MVIKPLQKQQRIKFNSSIAQSVEQQTVNLLVPGSSPGWGAKQFGRVAERLNAPVLKTGEDESPP